METLQQSDPDGSYRLVLVPIRGKHVTLTYFQVDVGVELLQPVGHAVRLDAGQLQQNRTMMWRL